MKRVNLLSGLFVILIVPTFINAGWLKTYGGEGSDYGVSMGVSYDDNFYILGNTENIGGGGTWLLKIDSTGDTIWSRTYDGYGAYADETTDHGYIIIGGSRLIKTDSIGNIIWTKTYTIGDERGWQGNCVQQTSDGCYIITGSIHTINAEPENRVDLLIYKVDSLGDSVWARSYGSEVYDWGNHIIETSDGGYAVTGHYGSVNGLWDADAWWFKTDTAGNYLWQDRISKGSGFSYEGYCINETSDSGLIITGKMEYFVASDSDYTFLVKTNSNGARTWTKQYYQGFCQAGHYVIQTTDNGYAMTGSWNNLSKIDDTGTLLWSRKYGGVSKSIIQTSDGGYMVYGTDYSTDDRDLWLLKTNAEGDTVTAIIERPEVQSPTFDVCISISSFVTIRYANHPSGFNTIVYDASGRQVDQLQSTNESGTITWGEGFSPGVYFIREISANPATHKVVITR